MMSRIDLDLLVRAVFKEWGGLLDAPSKKGGRLLKTLDEIKDLDEKSKIELLFLLQNLYKHLLNSLLNKPEFPSEEAKLRHEKSLDNLAELLSQTEFYLDDILLPRPKEALLSSPITFMQLAEMFSHAPKEAWRKMFAAYYFSGMYKCILDHNPIFTLHFTTTEKAQQDQVDRVFIKKLYETALQHDNFDLDKTAPDSENLLDKAIIFLRAEFYRLVRDSGPRYKNELYKFWAQPKEVKCEAMDNVIDLLLQDSPLENFGEVVRGNQLGMQGLLALFSGEAGAALAPLSIHMAVNSHYSSNLLLDAVRQWGASWVSYFNVT